MMLGYPQAAGSALAMLADGRLWVTLLWSAEVGALAK